VTIRRLATFTSWPLKSTPVPSPFGGSNPTRTHGTPLQSIQLKQDLPPPRWTAHLHIHLYCTKCWWWCITCFGTPFPAAFRTSVLFTSARLNTAISLLYYSPSYHRAIVGIISVFGAAFKRFSGIPTAACKRIPHPRDSVLLGSS
jgi:hypothetical protein